MIKVARQRAGRKGSWSRWLWRKAIRVSRLASRMARAEASTPKVKRRIVIKGTSPPPSQCQRTAVMVSRLVTVRVMTILAGVSPQLGMRRGRGMRPARLSGYRYW